MKKCLLDWRYHHPRLFLADLSDLREQMESGESPETYRYDPTEAFWREKERAKQKEECAELQETLDSAYRESVEKDRTNPPPQMLTRPIHRSIINS